MDRETELSVVRCAYAKQVLAAAGIDDPRVERAFATVRREHFLGPGPWPIFRWAGADSGYRSTPSADPVYLYTDQLVGIVPEKNLNNGQPSLHALLLSHAAIAGGDHVVHVGAGVGYFTAIMAEIAGTGGRVTAIELEPELAARAAANFAAATNVQVIAGDGTAVGFDPADVIYVNAGATRPAATWLDGLADGGRLILPLTTDQGFSASEPGQMVRRGAIFRIVRRGAAFDARWISPVAIFRCESARDTASEAALAAAFANGGWDRVTRLYRGDDIPAERCWLRAPGWCLAYE
jgi:protein-L-isoaspartate(D-aspartate) O-methyltransferase